MARTALTYPKTPVGGVYIKGAKSIEGATGDTAITTNGWIENEKYGIYTVRVATTTSVEFDTAVARTGAKTLKLSTTNTTGRVYGIMGYNGAPASPADADLLKRYAIPCKPSTEYVLRCFAKTTTTVTPGIYIAPYYYTITGTRTVGNPTNRLIGTNDWTLLTLTFTTGASDVWLVLYFDNATAGNVSDAWFDVNSLTLVETGATRTAPTYPRNPMGAVYIKGAKSIEGATGDTARTTTGWIENDEKFGWYLSRTAAEGSAEFDTAITRTGTKTVLLQTTDATGRVTGLHTNSHSLAALLKYCPVIKPSTGYTLNCYVKTTNAAADSVYLSIDQRNAAGTYVATATTNKLSGTNDWTLLTVTFTSNAAAKFFSIYLQIFVAGNVSSAWFDVNSLTLIETGITRGAVV